MTSGINFSSIDTSPLSNSVDSQFRDTRDRGLECQNLGHWLPGMPHLTTSKRKVKLTQFRVLYLDDSNANLKICKAMFDRFGIRSFVGVRSRQETLDLLREESEGINSFDLCIMDYNLDQGDTAAGFTGFEVAQEINPERNKKTVMMLYSTDFGTLETAQQETGKDFSRIFHLILKKPANPGRMKALLKEVYEFNPPLNESTSYEPVRVADEETQTAAGEAHQSAEVNNIQVVNVGLCSCGTSLCCIQ